MEVNGRFHGVEVCDRINDHNGIHKDTERLIVRDRLPMPPAETSALPQPTPSPAFELPITPDMVYTSGVMTRMVRRACSIAKTNMPVLVAGKSGVGKELVAKMIHHVSGHKEGPLVPVNCAAIPHELIESELFGCRQGGFTGARDRTGLFEQAGKGTIFLDEIAEMDPSVQTKLLRVLEDCEVKPVGATKPIALHCRIIAATNQNPEEAIRGKKLREDLYYRLACATVQVPSLSERPSDILPIAAHYLAKFSAEMCERPARKFSPDAEAQLVGFNWPGNVRQLKSVVQNAVLDSESETIEASILRIRIPVFGSRDETIKTMAFKMPKDPEDDGKGLTPIQVVVRDMMVKELVRQRGNQLASAKALRVARQTFSNWVKAFGIQEVEYL